MTKGAIKQKTRAEIVAGLINENEQLRKLVKITANSLMDDSNKLRQRDDEFFKIGMARDITPLFWKYVLTKLAKRENITLSIYGVPRSGKTGLGMSLAWIIAQLTGVPFPLDTSLIFKNQSIFLKYAPKVVFNGCYIIDEQKSRHTQIGSWAEEYELADIERITAKKCAHKLWLCPEYINRGGEFSLEIIGTDQKLGVTKALVHDIHDSRGLYLDRTTGHILIKHYDPSVTTIEPEELQKIPDSKLNPAQILRKNYESKKDIAINKLLARATSDKNLWRIHDAKQLSSDVTFSKCKNQTERVLVARALLPEGYVEEELKEICQLAKNTEILIELEKRLKAGEKITVLSDFT